MPVRKPALTLITVLLASLLLAACAPQARTVATSVLPTIFNLKLDGDQLLIQGRYLGNGIGGIAAGNYVLLGADANGAGGLAYEADSWSDSRITLTVPADAPTGILFVLADGQRSNQLTWSR